MAARNLPKEFLRRLRAVTSKRPKTVIDHIVKHGFITTEELKDTYGYDHPPRAARDVRELGIPLETFRVTNKQGRKIAAYRFGDPSRTRGGTLSGRRTFSKKFKQSLLDASEGKCFICLTRYEPRYLQVDHRVPYQVGGEGKGKRLVDEYMLLCSSCNRAKSWSCEHCRNWGQDRISRVCRLCYWGSPESYKHIALRIVRRLDVVWSEAEVAEYERLVAMSKDAQKTLPEYVKAVIREHLE